MQSSPKNERSHSLETRAVHAGTEPDPSTGAIMTPVYLTSTYVQERIGQLKQGYEYSRTGNPTRTAMEKALAALEGAEHCLAFSSGMGAATTVLHLLSAGDHVVCSDDVYGGTFRVLDRVFSRSGLTTSFVPLTDAKNLEGAIRPETKMVWIETPSNPLLKIIDIRAIATICKARGLTLVVDNTFATPIFQQPLALGADLVLHSTTKYVGGHSDVVGGAVLTSSEKLREELAYLQNAMGATPGPMDSWLTLRGIKTLALRMERHASNALALAKFLSKHPEVAKVIYPGLESHPQHELAKSQMAGFSGMISFVLKGDLARAKAFVETTELFALAESLGGVESLIELPSLMTHAAMPPEVRASAGIDDGLIRLSVGIEGVEDLIADLEQAFAATS